MTLHYVSPFKLEFESVGIYAFTFMSDMIIIIMSYVLHEGENSFNTLSDLNSHKIFE